MNYWPLLGIAVVVLGFALRLNPMLVVVAGALLNLLPGDKLASWGQWTTAVHIAAGCLLAALAVMHLYFVYAYAS